MQHWHRYLHLRPQPRNWYRARLREELRERRMARTLCQRLSETADVFYTISRAQNDGFPIRTLPLFDVFLHLPVYTYLLLKYTSRWGFYRVASCLCAAPGGVLMREVVNPAKDHKLDEVALRHGVDPVLFRRVCCRLRRVWPLLP